MNKNDIVIIGNSTGWSYNYLNEAGYQFADAYKNHGIIFRIIRELFFRYRIPGKRYFYNETINFEGKILVVGDSLITYDFMEWLYNRCPTCKIILKYDNPVNPNYSPDGFKDEWCVKWTADIDDAKKYNMHLYQGGGYMPQWKVKKTTPIYDVFYIGKDKNRLDRLRQIEEDMNNHGIKTMFYITWPRGWQKKDDGIHKPMLPYEGVLDYIGKSKAILHLLDGAQHGITLRIQESLIHKVKLITDDDSIVSYDFYSPNNIFILGKDDMNNLRDFLDSPYEEVDSDFFRHAYYDQMMEEIISESMKNNIAEQQ